MSKIYYNYNTIHNIIASKIHNIKEFNPDYIIAIGGGGLIPSRMIRTHIDKPILVITVSLYEGEKKGSELNVIQWINNNLKDKKVLIVDEIDDTRTTLDFCVKKLMEDNEANDIGVFVVHNKIKKKVTDLKDTIYMYGEEVKDNWIVYPWDQPDFY